MKSIRLTCRHLLAAAGTALATEAPAAIRYCSASHPMATFGDGPRPRHRAGVPPRQRRARGGRRCFTRRGELVWRREEYSFRDTPVADADGIYGWGTGPEPDSCGLIAVTADGDQWWDVPPLEDVGCGTELVPADDRLVAVADEGLYGLYEEPGRRYASILIPRAVSIVLRPVYEGTIVTGTSTMDCFR